MDRLEIHYRKQEGGFRLWVVSTNPKVMAWHCEEIKTAYVIDRNKAIHLASQWADYYRDEFGQRAAIKEIDDNANYVQ